MEGEKIVITVDNGIASVVFKPRGVEIEIVYDDRKDNYLEDEVIIEGVRVNHGEVE
jgi:hypothetical protein